MSYTCLWFSLEQVKVRVSLSGEDVRLLLSSTDTVLQAKLKLQVTSQFGQKIYINLIWTASLCPDLRMIFLQTESVFIYVIAILKNWFVTDSFANWFKNQYFYLSTNAIHKELRCFADFFKKIDSFWKRLILLKSQIEPTLLTSSLYFFCLF